MLEVMGNLADSSSDYITGGIAPESIVRGVDYLVRGDLVKEEDGVKVYRVADYIDRSEEEKIKQYLGSDKSSNPVLLYILINSKANVPLSFL